MKVTLLSPVHQKRRSQQDQRQPQPGFPRPLKASDHHEAGAEEYKNSRQHRVADGPVWARRFGFFAAQDEDAEGDGPVENEGSEDEHVRQLVEGAREDEQARPDALDHERIARRVEARVDAGDPGEEKPVPRQSEMNTGSSQDSCVGATEGGDTNQDRDEQNAGVTEKPADDLYGDDAVLVLGDGDHLVYRQYVQVGEVDGQVDTDDNGEADEERQRYVALRVFHLVADEADVQPAFVGPEGA